MDVHNNIPLQLQLPRKYGDMKHHHNYYLHLDRHELLLSENAAEIFAEWALHDGSRNLERMIEQIAMGNKSCVVFPCFTFPYYGSGGIEDGSGARGGGGAELQHMIDIARREFLEIENKSLVCSIIAVNAGEAGGHHCAVIYTEKSRGGDDEEYGSGGGDGRGEVILFDPMQHGTKSLYMEYFKDIARHVFMTEDIHVEMFDPVYNYKLQHTGGFMHIPPQHITVKKSNSIFSGTTEHWFEMVNDQPRKMSDHDKHELMFTSTESQNHFCYMWCVWYLHVKMAGLSVTDVVNNKLLGIDPLIIIKNYIWNMVTFTGFKKEFSLERFFNENFKLILLYSHTPSGVLRTYPCELNFSSKSNLRNINDCLTDSWRDTSSKCATRRELHPHVNEHYNKNVKNKEWSATYTKLFTR